MNYKLQRLRLERQQQLGICFTSCNFIGESQRKRSKKTKENITLHLNYSLAESMWETLKSEAGGRFIFVMNSDHFLDICFHFEIKGCFLLLRVREDT